MSTIQTIKQQMLIKNTLVCGGLDPDLSLLPTDEQMSALADEDKVTAFLSQVVEVESPQVCAFKANKGFFDLLPGGHDVLNKIIYLCHQQGVMVIVDGKFGETQNSMRKTYLPNIFKKLNADGIVVNPYMGDEVMLPLEEYSDKAIVVLVKTSGPGSVVIQNITTANGRPLWETVLQLAVKRWNKAGNIIPVIAPTPEVDLPRLRQMIPDDMLILWAGVGAQGGDFSGLPLLLNSQNANVLINSSRDLLYPTVNVDQTWQESIARAVASFRHQLNSCRQKARNEC